MALTTRKLMFVCLFVLVATSLFLLASKDSMFGFAIPDIGMTGLSFGSPEGLQLYIGLSILGGLVILTPIVFLWKRGSKPRPDFTLDHLLIMFAYHVVVCKKPSRALKQYVRLTGIDSARIGQLWADLQLIKKADSVFYFDRVSFCKEQPKTLTGDGLYDNYQRQFKG